jgi:hypothetical protein
MELIQHVHIVEAATTEGFERALAYAVSGFQDGGYAVEVQMIAPAPRSGWYSALVVARGV